MTEIKHTELPWKIERWDDDSPEFYKDHVLIFANGADVAYAAPRVTNGENTESEANAQFIVKACNNHEKLLALLNAAECPDPNCLDGSIPHQINENEWDAEQCQWCYEKDQIIKGCEQ